jgi:cellulose synthase/poly-beta-1,6-N-acetylglucosamine synthase-like glycosyltransferase
VIVPCKGDDGRLLRNLQTLLNQDYDNAEFVLVTATPQDPAQAVFAQLQNSAGTRRLKTVAAGLSEHCSEKNNNLLKAVAATDPASEVFVFLDADGKSDRHLISRLVAGLAESGAAAVTGNRWYEPRWSVLPELMRTGWTAGGYCFLIDPETSYVWGGAMALRRETFFESGIPAIWARTISDDMTLSVRLKELGLDVRFLTNCIVLSHEKDSWSSIFGWITRQTFMTRFYHPKFFAICFVDYVLGNALGLGLFFGGLIRGSALATLVGFAWMAHLWLFAALIVPSLRTLVKANHPAVEFRPWVLITAAPLAGLLQGASSVVCLFTKKVRWAGVTYEVTGHTTRVLR